MVRKFVYVPGPDPHLAPLHAERTSSAARLVQWLLLGVAITISVIGFSMAKASSTEAPAATPTTVP